MRLIITPSSSSTSSSAVSQGTLHLTPHHLIFIASSPSPPSSSTAQHGQYTPSLANSSSETYIPYPHIASLLHLPLQYNNSSPLLIRTKIFRSYLFIFEDVKEAEDVWASIKGCCLGVGKDIGALYAFGYRLPSLPNEGYGTTGGPLGDGWSVYNPKEEFMRMGVGTRTRGWRFTDINKDYTVSPFHLCWLHYLSVKPILML